MNSYYVITTHCGKFLATDSNSGGYPYWAPSVRSAAMFYDINEATNFWNKMQGLLYNTDRDVQPYIAELLVTMRHALDFNQEQHI